MPRALKLPIGDIYCDTNFFYNCADGSISTKKQDILRSQLTTSNHKLYASVVSVMEIASHVTKEKADNFGTYQKAMQALLHMTDDLLPDPDTYLRAYFGRDPRRTAIVVSQWLWIAKLIAHADDYRSLMKWSAYDDTVVPAFRAEIESKYVEQLRKVVSSQISNYHKRRAKGKAAKISNKQHVADLDTLFRSIEMRRAFVDLLIQRAGANLADFTETERAKICKDFQTPCDAFLGILRNIFANGYSVEGHKNDCNDLHLLFYLAAPDLVYLTADGKFLKHLSNSKSMRISLLKDCGLD